MRNSRLILMMVIAIAFISFNINSLTWSEEKKPKRKEVPQPHPLHLEVKSQDTGDFSLEEITDWEGFLKSLQAKLHILPLSDETRFLIKSYKPYTLTSDEKSFIVNEINKLLTNKTLPSQMKNIVTFSGKTKKLELDYRRTKTIEDMKWLNRSIINDMFAQTPRREKVKVLKKLACTTCHEAWEPAKLGLVEREVPKPITEGADILEVIAELIDRGVIKSMADIEKLIEEKKIKVIKPYDPLKNFVIRSDPKGEIPFFVAIHPEKPYTFKPLMERLVCLKCHGPDREIKEIKGPDGKIKKIYIFYGPIEETLKRRAEELKREQEK
ncbi:MAG: hypothetical protein AB1488_08060 [Nitrospirota bacterium]